MKTVYRYSLPWGPGIIRLPRGKVVHVGYQEARRACSVWIEVDEPEPQLYSYRYHLASTGAEIASDLEHVGSVIMPDGFHTFHLYLEEGRR